MFQVFTHGTQLSSERIANLLLLTCANLLMCKFAQVSKFSPYEWGVCMKRESCKLKTTQVFVSEPKCWQSSVVTLTYDLLIAKYRYLPLTVLHLCTKYESCTLKTIQVMVSEPKFLRTDRQKDRQTDKPDSYRAPA